jgi:cyclomaltodextrinase / maltogenic alpha-amylase / neopullulanase
MPDYRIIYQPPTSGAHQVGLAGDFTSWAIIDLIEVGGLYVLPIHLESGKYCYKLIVDGVWITDPANPNMEPDPFGGLNTVLIVKNIENDKLSWAEIHEDLAPLYERMGHYLDYNRISESEVEIRFNWFPQLNAEITATVDGKERPLFRLGSHDNKEVWHLVHEHTEDTIRIIISLRYADRTLFLTAQGWTWQIIEHVPMIIDLSQFPVFEVPGWVREGIIYQIFPDRFYNGSRALDPDFSEWYYADCKTLPQEGEFLPKSREYFHLVRDWNDIGGLKQSSWLPIGKPDWWSFYGGDIPGIHQKLDYLCDLGINIIYFNPLWQAKSNHKYDAADFQKIDPHFGSLQDIRHLLGELHQRGMHVIVDVAFNHTGETFWAFRDCLEKGSASEYWNWYDWNKWPLPSPLPENFNPKEYYQCWWGIKDMPDLNYDLKRTHPSENYIQNIAKAETNRPLVGHILETARWWLEVVGVDGFRLDVPDEVPFWFWQLFRAEIRKIKPDAWLIGELWQNAKGWIGPDYFDSVMNYTYFKDPVLQYFILGIITKSEFCELIEAGLAMYPIQAQQAMMNLLGSHDTIRIGELSAGKNDRLRLAILFQMTFVGTPHIYYGDEIAMGGGKDPDNRRPFNWDYVQNMGSVQHREYIREMIALRMHNPVLIHGEFKFVDSEESLLVYERFDDIHCERIIMNISDNPVFASLTALQEVLYSHGEIVIQESGFLIGANSAVVLSY